MRKIRLVVLFLCIIGLLTACDSYTKYTYSIGTGDRISVEVVTTDGYSLVDDNNSFNITKDDVAQGSFIFIEGDTYDMYLDGVNDNSDAEIVVSGERDDCTYVMYHYEDEWDYIIWITNTNTGVLFGTVISEEAAEECFSRIKFIVE